VAEAPTDTDLAGLLVGLAEVSRTELLKDPVGRGDAIRLWVQLFAAAFNDSDVRGFLLAFFAQESALLADKIREVTRTAPSPLTRPPHDIAVDFLTTNVFLMAWALIDEE